MNKQNEKFTELTPEQMDKISGGTGSNQATIFCCPKCGAKFTIPKDYLRHLETCILNKYVDPNPQPAPLPKPDDEKIAPVG